MYEILLQKGKFALGVVTKRFDSYREIDEWMDKNYPDCFYSSDFADSDNAKAWRKKFGEITI